MFPSTASSKLSTILINDTDTSQARNEHMLCKMLSPQQQQPHLCTVHCLVILFQLIHGVPRIMHQKNVQVHISKKGRKVTMTST